MIHEQLIPLRTKDGIHIALWKLSNNDQETSKHIFLTHGTFSNKKVLLGIAKYLVAHHYVCWILEWRGHGQSDMPNQAFNFETISEFDMVSVFDYLIQKVKIDALHCVTHSGGGICLTMFLIKNPEFIKYIKSISFFGCQAFGAAKNLKNRILIWLSKYLCAILGYSPAQTAGSSEHDESYYMMKQWFDWNLSQRFIGQGEFNYQDLMQNITVPILSISAKGDHFIAPYVGCRKYVDAFQNKENVMRYFALENGNLENYNHSRILLSKNAKAEIWPLVLEWIQDHETEITASG